MSVHKPESRPPINNKNQSSASQEENSQTLSHEINRSQTPNSSQEKSFRKTHSSSSSLNSTEIEEDVYQTSLNDHKKIKQRRTVQKKESENPKPKENKEDVQNSKCAIVSLMTGLSVLILIFVSGYLSFAQANGVENQKTCKAFDPEGLFNVNDQISIKSAVNEINKFNKAKVLLLLYSEKQSGPLINKMVNMLLDYATCELGKMNDFVEFHQEKLQSTKIRGNWGKLISIYSRDLHKKNVLLVRHLEKTPGEVATVFHFLCDEYSPAVSRLLTIFTLEYRDDDQLGKTSDYNVVEKVLLQSWGSTMHADKIDPLITRITSAIIRV